MTDEQVKQAAEKKYVELPGWKAHNIHVRAERRAFTAGAEMVLSCGSELNGKILQLQDHIKALRDVCSKQRATIAEKDKQILAGGDAFLGLVEILAKSNAANPANPAIWTDEDMRQAWFNGVNHSIKAALPNFSDWLTEYKKSKQ